MPATEFSEIRAALVTALDVLNNTDVLGTGEDWINVSPYAIPDPGFRNVSIMVWGIASTDYSTFQQGGSDIQVTVRAVSGTMTEVAPQMLIDHLVMGVNSVKDLIEADRTLGGKVDDLFVSHMTGHREFPQGASRVLGVEWTIDVTLSGV